MALYKGWEIFRSSIGSQTWVARKHGVTLRANTEELLRSMIDERKPLNISREDIEKYGTEEEKKTLLEIAGGDILEVKKWLGTKYKEITDVNADTYLRGALNEKRRIINILLEIYVEGWKDAIDSMEHGIQG
jgi:hypothetical protein